MLQRDNRHLHEVGDAAPANLDIVGFFLQSGAVTLRTRGLATITAKHDAILDFVLVLLNHLEERVDAYAVVLVAMLVGGQAVPKLVFLFLREVVVRLEDREVVLCGPAAELFFPHAHLLAVPADHAAVVDRQRGIGDDQMFVDADNLAKALTFRARSYGRVERK